MKHHIKTDCTEGASDVNNQVELVSTNIVPHGATGTLSGKSSKHDRFVPTPTLKKASRTIDTTIFMACRASDILFITLWRGLTSRHRSVSSSPSTLAARSINILETIATPTVFSISSAIIMWSWFYSPDALPRSYNAWISSAAQIDPRLIQVLRECRLGTFVYGRKEIDMEETIPKGDSTRYYERSPHRPGSLENPTRSPPLLTGLAKDLSLPPSWGDPFITIPIPCELYHSGAGPSCEWHALTRFARGWVFAMKMYFPLHLLGLLLRLRNRSRHRSRSHSSLSKNESNKKPLNFKSITCSSNSTTSLSMIAKTLLNATRSSTFLATFISLFYYGVCLTRTRLGPAVLRHRHSQQFQTPTSSSFSTTTSSTATAQYQDQAQYLESSPAILTGCLLCGWSILIENPARREEIMAFVVPRAVGVFLPRKGNGRKVCFRLPTSFVFLFLVFDF